MRHNLFTTAAVDNIDHNPSSTTAKDSFHGTGISLFQHPTKDNDGTDRDTTILQEARPRKTIAPLPEFYTTITPIMLKKCPPVPENDGPEMLEDGTVTSAIQEEYK